MENRLLMFLKNFPYVVLNVFMLLYCSVRSLFGIDATMLRYVCVGTRFKLRGEYLPYEVVERHGFYVRCRSFLGDYKNIHASRWVEII